MSPRRSRPFEAGRPIVVTIPRAALHLGATTEEVAAAVAGLPVWGLDSQQRPVWRLEDVEQTLGRPEPPPRRRGDPWRGRPIPGTRGVTGRRGRQEPPGLLGGDQDAPGGLLEPQGGRGRAAAVDEEG